MFRLLKPDLATKAINMSRGAVLRLFFVCSCQPPPTSFCKDIPYSLVIGSVLALALVAASRPHSIHDTIGPTSPPPRTLAMCSDEKTENRRWDSLRCPQT